MTHNTLISMQLVHKAMAKKTMGIALLVLVLLAPGALGAVERTDGPQTSTIVRPFIKVVGVIESGDVVLTIEAPELVADSQSTFTVGVTLTGPSLLAVVNQFSPTLTCVLVGPQPDCIVLQTQALQSSLVGGFYAHQTFQVSMNGSCETMFLASMTIDYLLVTVADITITGARHVTAISCPQNIENTVAIDSWPDLNVSLAGALEVAVSEWPQLFASVDVESWPALMAVLSGSVEVTGVGGGNTSIGNITVEAGVGNLEEASGLNGVDWIFILFLIITAVVVWLRSKEPIMSVLMAVLVAFAGVLLILVWLIVHWNGLLAMAAIAIISGAYMVIRNAIDEVSGE